MYIVRWNRTVLDRMTEIWLDATDRTSITAAVADIDRVLAVNPHEAGESRNEDVRVLFEPPIGVFFEVDESESAVHILRVWTF